MFGHGYLIVLIYLAHILPYLRNAAPKMRLLLRSPMPASVEDSHFLTSPDFFFSGFCTHPDSPNTFARCTRGQKAWWASFRESA